MSGHNSPIAGALEYLLAFRVDNDQERIGDLKLKNEGLRSLNRANQLTLK